MEVVEESLMQAERLTWLKYSELGEHSKGWSWRDRQGQALLTLKAVLKIMKLNLGAMGSQ